jgi:hypothetical protein
VGQLLPELPPVAHAARPRARSLTFGVASDPCWSRRDALVIEGVDALHDTATIPDALWARLDAVFEAAELLDLTLLAGWYHAISYAANAARVELEEWAPRFVDHMP